MTERDTSVETDIDTLLAEVAATPVPEVSDTLIARILFDADHAQPAAPVAPVAPPSVWHRLRDAIGGWPALGGLAAASVTGLWIGISPPDALVGVSGQLAGDAVSMTLYSEDAYWGGMN